MTFRNVAILLFDVHSGMKHFHIIVKYEIRDCLKLLFSFNLVYYIYLMSDAVIEHFVKILPFWKINMNNSVTLTSMVDFF